MPWNPPERLASDRVALRPLGARDVDVYARWFLEDPQLGVQLGLDHDLDAAGVRALIRRSAEREASGEGLTRAIADADSDQLLGALMLHSVSWENSRCEVGFVVAPQARGQGIGRDGVALVLDWVFSELSFARVELTTTPDNEAAKGLAARLGFTMEGTLRSRDVERGRRVDIVWFGLLREDWRAAPSTRVASVCDGDPAASALGPGQHADRPGGAVSRLGEGLSPSSRPG
ncbi:MAG TPA: GNAT family protein [Solirubrobacteraceae bacterium]